MNFKIKLIVLFFITGISYSQGVVTQNGLLQVSGNKILNKKGEVFSMAGNSIFWSGFINDGGKLYRKDVVDHLAQEWNTPLIRAAMAVEEADGSSVNPKDPRYPGALVINPSGEGYFNNPAKEYAKIKVIIDAAIANDIYVIVDFHSHFAQLFKDEAIKFFTDIATEYGDNEHIIYEIFNEPIGTALNRAGSNDMQSFSQFDETWNTIIKPYSIDVIKAIRAIDPDNMIIVGTPGFSQGVDAASRNPITKRDLGFGATDMLNISYTLHFYASSHGEGLRNLARTALNNGIALFVTEWGTVEASGSGRLGLTETMTWLQFLKDNDISHANWSVSDKGADTSSIIKGGFGAEGLFKDALTPSGNLIRCVIEKWNAGEDFTTCNTDAPDTGGGTGNTLVLPEGVGIKVENGFSDWQSDGVKNATDIIDGNLIFGGFVAGEAAAYNLRSFTGFDTNKSYTVQIVVSSDGSGNVLKLERNAGAVTLGTVPVPRTGNNEFEIVTISGVTFERDPMDNIAFAVAVANPGTSSFSVASIFIAEDNDPALSVPEFDADLAKKISMYPNPVVDFITIDSSEDISYKVFGIGGGELIAKTAYTTPVNVTSLNSGIYFIQLYVKGQTQVFKFVKQ